jgi:hypothetical protein
MPEWQVYGELVIVPVGDNPCATHKVAVQADVDTEDISPGDGARRSTIAALRAAADQLDAPMSGPRVEDDTHVKSVRTFA